MYTTNALKGFGGICMGVLQYYSTRCSTFWSTTVYSILSMSTTSGPYIFIPRINRSLKEFVNSWNNHPIRTAQHKSPQQLFTAGCLLLQNSQIPALDFFHSFDDTYGIDPDGPIPISQESISVPQSTLRFSDADMQLLKHRIDPFWGIG